MSDLRPRAYTSQEIVGLTKDWKKKYLPEEGASLIPELLYKSVEVLNNFLHSPKKLETRESELGIYYIDMIVIAKLLCKAAFEYTEDTRPHIGIFNGPSVFKGHEVPGYKNLLSPAWDHHDVVEFFTTCIAALSRRLPDAEKQQMIKLLEEIEKADQQESIQKPPETNGHQNGHHKKDESGASRIANLKLSQGRDW